MSHHFMTLRHFFLQTWVGLYFHQFRGPPNVNRQKQKEVGDVLATNFCVHKQSFILSLGIFVPETNKH